MKPFLKKIGFFFSFIFIFMLGLIWYSNKMVTDNLNKEKNISLLVLGDSHTQNGLNIENKIPNSLNLSASAESYYFCYNKLKYFTDRNIPIDRLILGYGPHSLSKSLDTIWLMAEDNFIEKFRSYSPFLNYGTIPIFFKQVNWTPFMYFKLLPPLVYQPFYAFERKLLLNKLPFIGGFEPNTNRLKSDSHLNDSLKKSEISLSDLQLFYLQRISDLCESKGIELILLNVPVFSGEKVGSSLIENSKFKVLDYGDLWKGNEYYFADYVHLNEIGAKEFSSILLKDLETEIK
jgi:hypothetical protein